MDEILESGHKSEDVKFDVPTGPPEEETKQCSFRIQTLRKYLRLSVIVCESVSSDGASEQRA